MSKFQVGEIAVWAAPVYWPEYAGDEVLIVQAGDFPAGHIVPGRARQGAKNYTCRRTHYVIQTTDGYQWHAEESRLRKRRPPGADIVREFMYDLPREVMV